MMDIHTNHAKSSFLGIQNVVKPPEELKVEKMTGKVVAGGSLAGVVSGAWHKTNFRLDFDVTLPLKEAGSGIGCAQ